MTATANLRSSAEPGAEASAQHDTLADLYTALVDEMHKLLTGDGWRAWLQAAARFHQYSFLNTLLIHPQRPDATHVAGYRVWQSLGRQVHKAESVAYLVATVHGIDTADYAFDYLAGWASSKGDDIVGVTHEVGARVVRTAHDILDRVGSSDTADDGRLRELQVPSAKNMSIDGAPANRVGNQVHAPSIRWHRFTEDDGERGL